MTQGRMRRTVIEVDLTDSAQVATSENYQDLDQSQQEELSLIAGKVDQFIDQIGFNDDQQVLAREVLEVFARSGYSLDQSDIVLTNLKSIFQHLKLLYTICFLKIVHNCPADLQQLTEFTQKLISMDRNQPDRGCKATLKVLELVKPSSLAQASKLLDLIETTGTEACLELMAHQQIFEQSTSLEDLYFALAKTGAVYELGRFDNLAIYLGHHNLDHQAELDIVIQMIETGKQAMAITTLAALEDLYSRPSPNTKTAN